MHQAGSSGSMPGHRLRRLSADLGGLHLAVENGEHGQGWLGVSAVTDEEFGTQYAELLSDMHTQTLHTVNEHGSSFLNLPSVPSDLSIETRRQLIQLCEGWDFEPHDLGDSDKVLACALILFEALFRIEGMEEMTGISMTQIYPFIWHLRQIYRLENSYHNFEHAVDVLQAIYMYLRTARMVPPISILLEFGGKWKRDTAFDSGPLLTSLGLLELFVLYTAAIGHDVGHPGFTNMFMKNAETPLSIVFDGKSPLEQMHYQFLVRVMRYHGMGVLLDHSTHGAHVRKLLLETILATDMSVHKKFMEDFSQLVNGPRGPLYQRQVMMCQALMKCADISNPSRPYAVAKNWAAVLMEEWSSQALFEKHLRLPVSVQSSDTPLNLAKSQIFFITQFAKPLLDITVQAVPDMKRFVDYCLNNLRKWKRQLKRLESSTEPPDTRSCSSTPRHPDGFTTAFPLTLPPSHRSVSHTEETQFVWSNRAYAHNTPSGSGPSSSESSTDSNPCSPSTSVSFFVLSATTDCPTLSSAGSSTTCSVPSSCDLMSGPQQQHVPQDDGNKAIRLAGKLGIRKQRSLNRNSWSPYGLSTNHGLNQTGSSPLMNSATPVALVAGDTIGQ